MTIKQRIKYLIYTRLPGKAGRMKYFNSTLHFPVSSHLFERLCREGIYECDLIHCMLDFIPEGGVVYDVGANIGLSALPILSARKEVEVVSFEPSPSAHPFLNKTQTESPYQARWKVENLAVADVEGNLTFYTHGVGESAFDGLADNKRPECGAPAQKVSVKVTTIDQYAASVNQQRIDLMKIDVEGFEPEVLQGASETIKRFKPVIFLEWTDKNRGSRPVVSLLKIANSLGMELYSAPDLLRISTERDFDLKKRKEQNFMLIPMI